MLFDEMALQRPMRDMPNVPNAKHPFFEAKRNQQPHQPEKLKLKDNAKMGNGSGLNKGTPIRYFSPIDRSFRVPSNVR